MEFLGGGLLKLMSNILRVVLKNNHKYGRERVIPHIINRLSKLKKEFLCKCISKVFFIDTEQLSKM